MSYSIPNFFFFFVSGGTYKGHIATLAPTVKELAELEKRAQTSFIDLQYKKKFMTRWRGIT